MKRIVGVTPLYPAIHSGGKFLTASDMFQAPSHRKIVAESFHHKRIASDLIFWCPSVRDYSMQGHWFSVGHEVRMMPVEGVMVLSRMEIDAIR